MLLSFLNNLIQAILFYGTKKNDINNFILAGIDQIHQYDFCGGHIQWAYLLLGLGD